MKFNGAIVSKPLKDELEKALVPLEEKIEETQQKTLQRGSANIAFTDIGNYDPSKIPEAVFEIVVDNGRRLFKIVEKKGINDGFKYTLSSSTVTAEEAANIYFITVETKSGLAVGYKFTLNTSGVTKTLISTPTSLKVYFDFM